jgi:hypothetical protein
MPIIQYEHHGRTVWVDEDRIGLHRQVCLCLKCANFKPGLPEENCPIANLVFAACLAHGLVTPVLECPEFSEKAE